MIRKTGVGGRGSMNIDVFYVYTHNHSVSLANWCLNSLQSSLHCLYLDHPHTVHLRCKEGQESHIGYIILITNNKQTTRYSCFNLLVSQNCWTFESDASGGVDSFSTATLTRIATVIQICCFNKKKKCIINTLIYWNLKRNGSHF